MRFGRQTNGDEPRGSNLRKHKHKHKTQHTVFVALFFRRRTGRFRREPGGAAVPVGHARYARVDCLHRGREERPGQALGKLRSNCCIRMVVYVLWTRLLCVGFGRVIW